MPKSGYKKMRASDLKNPKNKDATTAINLRHSCAIAGGVLGCAFKPFPRDPRQGTHGCRRYSDQENRDRGLSNAEDLAVRVLDKTFRDELETLGKFRILLQLENLAQPKPLGLGAQLRFRVEEDFKEHPIKQRFSLLHFHTLGVGHKLFQVGNRAVRVAVRRLVQIPTDDEKRIGPKFVGDRNREVVHGGILPVVIVNLECLDQAVRRLGFVEDEQLVAERRIRIRVDSGSQTEVEEEFPRQ